MTTYWGHMEYAESRFCTNLTIFWYLYCACCCDIPVFSLNQPNDGAQIRIKYCDHEIMQKIIGHWFGIKKAKVIDWSLSLFNYKMYFRLNNIVKQKTSILLSRVQDFVVKMLYAYSL